MFITMFNFYFNNKLDYKYANSISNNYFVIIILFIKRLMRNWDWKYVVIPSLILIIGTIGVIILLISFPEIIIILIFVSLLVGGNCKC